jgi:NDP-sugar pyrophosphorylase family protein
MKAFVFAAGLGTRLKPLTDTMPKALVPIQEKPLLGHVMEKLQRSGINEFVVNIHHFGEQIIDYLKKNWSDVPIAISDERAALLETGGAVKKAIPLLGTESFLIHNVDILSNANLAQLASEHTHKKAAATLLVSNRKSSRYLLFDKDMRLKAWTNTQTGEVKSPYQAIDMNTLTPYAFGGIHCFSPMLFDEMSTYPDKFSIIDFYLEQCLKYPIYGWEQEDLQLLDVGKINSLELANAYINQQEEVK